jgi:hypothetical protein
MTTKNYTVLEGCEVAGVWRVAGKPFQLTDEQAKYLAPPLGSTIVPVVVPKGRRRGRLNRN